MPQSEGNPGQTPRGQTERTRLNNKQWKAWNSGFGSNQSWRGVGPNSVFIVFLLSFCSSAEHEVILVDTDAASRWASTDRAEFQPNLSQCLPFLGPRVSLLVTSKAYCQNILGLNRAPQQPRYGICRLDARVQTNSAQLRCTHISHNKKVGCSNYIIQAGRRFPTSRIPSGWRKYSF